MRGSGFMKRYLNILCGIIFVVLVLTGCFNTDKNVNSSGGNNVQLRTEEKVAPSTKTESKINVYGNGQKIKIEESGSYTDKEHVAAYINTYAKLPRNYITKNQAKKLGWQTKGSLDKVAPGKSIGGDRYGNYERILPHKNGRVWTECDIDYVMGNRNAKRIVFSDDGLIYYTKDHYKSFEKLY